MPVAVGNQIARKMDMRRKAMFLEKFAELGFARKACSAINVSPTTVYTALRQDEDFKEAFEEIKDAWDEEIEIEAHRRAVYGVQRIVVQGGKVIFQVDENGVPTNNPLMETIFSDRLIEFVLRARMPTKYGNKLALDTQNKSGVLRVPAPTIEVESFEVQMANEEVRRVERFEEDTKLIDEA